MTIIKRATFKYPDGHTLDFALVKREHGDFRWIYSESGDEVSGVAYLSESDAIRAMRVNVDHEPELAGIDLTIVAVDPPPEARAAKRIIAHYRDGIAHEISGKNLPIAEEVIADLIANETGLSALTDAFSNLMAYCMIHRSQFARAIYPVTSQGAPRDLAFDGLLLIAIEAMQKSTGQDFSNLIKPLKEPVSQIVGAKAMPRGNKT